MILTTLPLGIAISRLPSHHQIKGPRPAQTLILEFVWRGELNVWLMIEVAADMTAAVIVIRSVPVYVSL
jgi:hypothetical protein